MIVVAERSIARVITIARVVGVEIGLGVASQNMLLSLRGRVALAAGKLQARGREGRRDGVDEGRVALDLLEGHVEASVGSQSERVADREARPMTRGGTGMNRLAEYYGASFLDDRAFVGYANALNC